MPSPKSLTLIVPAYNSARFIEPCLRAILAQLAVGHQLVVIDDGSTDATFELAEGLRREYADADFTLLRQPNAGVAAARNRGLAEARGEYIVFIDADDLLQPGILAALDGVIDSERPDVIACDFNFWRPDNERKSRPVSLGYAPDALSTDRDAILSTFFADRHTYVWANVFRREIYERAGMPVFPAGRVFEDLSTLAPLLARCRSLYHLARPIIDYRQHGGSITKAVCARWCLDFAAALQQNKRGFAALAASDAVRLHIDAAACHFYIGIVKNSYELSWGEGRAVRAEVKARFLDSLFHQPEQVLAAMEGGRLLSHDRKGDAAAARQVRKALAGSLAFGIGKTASRRIKMWQRMVAA
jgi:hypothetical protein